MTASLLDIAKSLVDQRSESLEWVGMENVSLPITLNEEGCSSPTSGSVSIFVDLPAGPNAVKGIHMSRLYNLLNKSSVKALNPALLKELLSSSVVSHEDCSSRKAKIIYSFPFLYNRPALITPDLSGWQCYPVVVTAERDDDTGRESVCLSVDITYSSTCPCSAALSRQVIRDAFTSEHEAPKRVDVKTVADWIEKNGTMATPHSQRSIASVSIPVDNSADTLGIPELINRVEAALSTPVQTLVKRADEQAFARLNGENLMYVEDAARRLTRALATEYARFDVKVRHLESLHAHDAVAYVSSSSGIEAS
ncbi:GTP cyclohydrolase FolE2 [Psychrobacter sp. LV10R520-6]|uniref:GTP cyclohydrolase FolE2 n=1 Tax=Psychrobacter sp. LV10R520-6 TaxID=1415574 RepID=UPI0024CC3C84|nr:GTP cyclohydrolase FolE2 [Psychrobacter sp. LV10R520-6]SNT69852.1 GTP cyclohydrolase I [Psychrobacter sp. LV10R520-6]